MDRIKGRPQKQFSDFFECPRGQFLPGLKVRLFHAIPLSMRRKIFINIYRVFRNSRSKKTEYAQAGAGHGHGAGNTAAKRGRNNAKMAEERGTKDDVGSAGSLFAILAPRPSGLRPSLVPIPSITDYRDGFNSPFGSLRCRDKDTCPRSPNTVRLENCYVRHFQKRRSPSPLPALDF